MSLDEGKSEVDALKRLLQIARLARGAVNENTNLRTVLLRIAEIAEGQW